MNDKIDKGDKIDLSSFSRLDRGRVEALLDKVLRWEDGDYTTRQWIEKQSRIHKSQGDGMLNFNRTRYNRLDRDGQAAYEARLRAQRFYYLNGREVPKLVYDAVRGDEPAGGA